MLENIKETISQKEKELQSKEENLLKNKGYFDGYGGEIKVTYIKKNVFAVEGSNGNITYYINEKGDIIFSAKSLSKINLFSKYTELLGIKEGKNESGEYEVFLIKDGLEKIKLDKYSIEYFKVWETISFLQGRDLILHTLEGNRNKTIIKIDSKHIERMINERVIRLIDLAIFLSKGNLTQDQFKKYHKPVMNLLLDQIGDERFSLLPNNKQYQLSTKEGSFQISTGKVTKEELNYLLSAKLLSPEIHQLAIEKIDELEKLEAEKNTELKKDLDQLENEIRDTK